MSTDNRERGAVSASNPLGQSDNRAKMAAGQAINKETKASMLISALDSLNNRANQIHSRLILANDRISGPVPMPCEAKDENEMADNCLILSADRQLSDLSDTLLEMEAQLNRLEEFA